MKCIKYKSIHKFKKLTIKKWVIICNPYEYSKEYFKAEMKVN